MRVLVVYGSMHGGTAGLAQMVAEALVDYDILADIGDAAEVDGVDAYDAVVIGGALYDGRWHRDATDFVERNASALRGRPVWLFSSGPLSPTARSGAIAPVPSVLDLANAIDARGHMTFGGRLAKPRGGFLGSMLAWGPPGDYRDGEQVTEWVRRIVARLKAHEATALPDLADTSHRVAARTQQFVDDDDLGIDVFSDQLNETM
jgi:menaquinone-dependent protoporphyrinogen oxidase